MPTVEQQTESPSQKYIMFRDNTFWSHIVEESQIRRIMDEQDLELFVSAHPLKLIEYKSKGILPFQRSHAVVEVVQDYKRKSLYQDFLRQHQTRNVEEITLDNLTYTNKLVLENVVTSGKNANFVKFNDQNGVGYIVNKAVCEDVKDGRFKTFFETQNLYRFVIINNNGRAEVQTVPNEDQEGRLQLLKYLISCYLGKDPAETAVQKILDRFRKNKQPDPL